MREAPPHVRPANLADAESIAAVQTRAWAASYAGIAPLVTGSNPAQTAADIAAAWRHAVQTPPTRRHQVLVAVSDGLLVGLVACDGDGEVVALEVDPAHRRAGHGSRLLAATADHARAVGLGTLGVWCPVPDEPRRAFLQSAGFVPDQGLRTLESSDGTKLDEAHLVTVISS